MKKTTSELRSLLAAALLIGSCLASARGIEATSEGTDIVLSAQKMGNAARLVEGGDASLIRVKGKAGTQSTLHVFDLEAPGIDSDGYAVIGEVRYDGVEGEGFLEMWSHLPAEEGGSDIATSFFSRTMDISGPLGKLSGDSDWRAFQLPGFINDGSDRRPLKLTLNVVLPGEGTVEVRNLKLQKISVPVMSNLSGMSPVAISVLSVAAGAALAGLIWFLRKRRSQTELRRIQALDS